MRMSGLFSLGEIGRVGCEDQTLAVGRETRLQAVVVSSGERYWTQEFETLSTTVVVLSFTDMVSTGQQ